jgi:hypothetical protein
VFGLPLKEQNDGQYNAQQREINIFNKIDEYGINLIFLI